MTIGPRIALIHALEESIEPARASFRRLWPEAFCFDLLDTSLAKDRAEVGRLTDPITQRIGFLADYAANAAGCGGDTAGILFTCSAFGPAIHAAKQKASLPILSPNEAAFNAALDVGSTFVLLVTFPPSSASLEAELREIASARGAAIRLTTLVVEGALDALKSGDGGRHDSLIAEAAARQAGQCDAFILGQFSMARARAQVEQKTATHVITTPDSAVEALRKRIENRHNPAGATTFR